MEEGGRVRAREEGIRLASVRRHSDVMLDRWKLPSHVRGMTTPVDLGYHLITGAGVMPGEPGEEVCPPSYVYYVSGDETQHCALDTTVGLAANRLLLPSLFSKSSRFSPLQILARWIHQRRPMMRSAACSTCIEMIRDSFNHLVSGVPTPRLSDPLHHPMRSLSRQ